jgi:hypothetical protein
MSEIVRATGALAGLLAILGLAVLSTLYVAHAREVRRLREWAGGAPERSRSQPRRASRRLRVRPVVIAVLVLGVAAAYGLTRLGGDGETPTRTAQAKPHKPAVVKPADVTVAVLNATTVPGLAASLRDQLAADGFQPGLIDVYADQQRTGSVVQYVRGHAAEAAAVGRRLRIDRREPATADARALAGDATVIVIAGADQAP